MAIITGTAGSDVLLGTTADDTINGLAGDDAITDLGGNDSIDGGDGNDNIDGGPGNDTIFGGTGNDYLKGGSGNDSLDGGLGDDYLIANSGEGNETLLGGDGNDTLFINSNNFTSTPETVVINGGAGDDLIQTYLPYWSHLTIVGTGGPGIDTYELGNAVDISYTITDFAVGTGGDRIDVTAPIYILGVGYAGGNPFSAGNGYLRLTQHGADAWLEYDRDGTAGTAYGFQKIIVLQGTVATALTADNFVGGIPPDGSAVPGLVLNGTAGNDTLTGGFFNDTINGLSGSDTITGGGGNDIIYGGDDNGLAFWDDHIDGGPGDDTIYGGTGRDYLIGGIGNDLIDGGSGDDYLSNEWSSGNDTMYGGDGNDTLRISSYDLVSKTLETVVVDGGAGDDLILSRLQSVNRAVVATGGQGVDTYQFESGDGTVSYTVTDFAVGAGGDRIDVAALINYSASNGLGYGGGNPFSMADGYLRLTQHGANTWLEYDEDGAARTAHSFHTAIVFQGVAATALTADNFVGGIAPDGSAVPGLVLNGTADHDTLIGGFFDDTINGLGGWDVLKGGGGDDLLNGGTEDDDLWGGIGNDTLYGGEGNDELFGEAGNDSLDGGAGNDTLTSINQDLEGSGGGDDTLQGGDGNDTIFVFSNSSTLATIVVDGGPGNDLIQTYLIQGSNLVASGGNGIDTYQFQYGGATEKYTIADFTPGPGGDLFDVAALLNYSATGGRGYTGGSPFSTANGYLRLLQSGADTLFQYDEDGAAGTAYSLHTIVVLQNVTATAITPDNFVGKIIVGTDADDVLIGEWTNDILLGLAGNDILDGAGGADRMEGGTGNDVYFVDDPGDLVVETDNGPSGPLAIIAGGADGVTDTVKAAIEYVLAQFVENLTLIGIAIKGTGNALDNVITGNSLNNVLKGLEGNDTIDGGVGIDTAVYTGVKANYTVARSGNTYTVTDSVAGRDGTDTLTSIETLVFTDGTQHLASTLTSAVSTTLPADSDNLTLTGSGNINGTGNALDNVITGNSGNNVLDGGAGNDMLTGGLGNDTIIAGDGDDIVICTHDDGVDSLSGGPGFDILDYSAVNGVVQINQLGGVATGSAGNDIIVDVFEQVIGTNFDDVLSGGHGGDVLYGNGGNDKFFGNNGDDLMSGGDGNDTFYFSVGDGNDRLEGGNGFDVLDYSSLPGIVQVNQLAGTTSGTAGNDILVDVIEQIIGSAFDDVLSGGHGINSINGGAGNDQIFANRGDDNVVGGPGNDTIKLGPGNDVAAFRNGDGVDTILDFVAGGTDDSIRLKNYSGIPTTFAGLQANGNIVQNGSETDIVLLNGDMIILQNVTATNLDQSDFLF